LTVDPLDVEALADAIARVLHDTDLRARLSTAGLQRAATFSWDDTARIILKVYQEVYENALRTSWR
jgi:glycosyltransferase involved in cell wall biosynthesis